MKLAAGASKIVATKGKKIIELDMANSNHDDAELSALIVGPSGNLRAPAAWIGKTLVVGFDENMYANALK